ncbi:MAG: hypothetical protein ACK5ZU_08560, partial [Acidobacteriota bacterium]
LQELHRLPLRIERTTKLLRHEIAARHALMAEDPSLQFEPIPDAPPLPQELFDDPEPAPPSPQIEAKPFDPDSFNPTTAPLPDRLYFIYHQYLARRDQEAAANNNPNQKPNTH